MYDKFQLTYILIN